MKKLIFYSAMLVILASSISTSAQQLTGIKTIKLSGGDYANFTSAIADLNIKGVGPGGVIFKVAANSVFNEANILITASGSPDNPILFQKDGTGANPVVTGQGVSGAVADYFFKIAGGDNITFDGIDLTMNPAVNDDLLKIEYGFYITNITTTDASRFITINNSVIQLERTPANDHVGVFMWHEVSPADYNSVCSNITLDNITVKKGSDGIVLIGRSSVYPSGNISISSCKIGLPGSTSLLTDANTSFGYGIGLRYCKDATVFNNEIQNIITNNTCHGIYLETVSGEINVYNNKVHKLFSTKTTPDIDVMGIYHVSSAPTISYIFNNLVYDLDDSQTSGSAGYYHLTGIYVSGTGTNNVFNNTICFSSDNPYTLSVPLWVPGVYNVKNNIVADFSVPPVNTARALVLTSSTTPATIENNLLYIDESITNNFSFVASSVNYKFKDFQKGTVKPSPGYYLKNIFANPNFTDLEWLIPSNPSLASDNGQPIPWSAYDIINTPRNVSKPDIGAYEGDFGVQQDLLPPLIRFQPLTNNSDAVVKLTALITDNREVKTAKLWYRLRGTTNEFTELAGSKFGETWIFSFTPPAPGFYEYFVCAKDISDNVIANGFVTSGLDVSKTGLTVNNPPSNPDYVYTFGYKQQLSGNITVGYESSTYASLTGAGGLFDAINNSVITGNINVVLTTDIIEPGTIDLRQWTESGTGGYSLTIKPNNSNLHTLITLSAGKSIILNGVDRVTIDGSYNNDNLNHIKIENSGSNPIRIISDNFNGCEGITIRYINMTSGSTSAITSSGSNHRNWLIENVYIDKGAAGINIVNVTNTVVKNCTFGSTDINNTINNYGLYIIGSSNVTVEKNTVRNIISSSAWPRGLYLYNVTGGIIQKNKITGIYLTGTSAAYGATGIFINRCSSLALSNNVISDIKGYGSSSALDYMTAGITLFYSSNVKAYHNSVNLFGTTNSLNNALCSALHFYNNSGCEIINNIFSNTIENGNSTTTTSALMHLADFDRSNTFRNNLYYCGGSGTNKKFLIYYKSPIPNLANWQDLDLTLSDGIDLGSGGLLNPEFVSGSTNDLRLSNVSPALNSGKPVTVTDDFNGTPRSTTSPDIGAFEDAIYTLGIDECSPVISFTPIQNSANTTFIWSAIITDNLSVSAAKLWYRLKSTSDYFTSVTGVKQADNKTWNFSITTPLNPGSEYEYFVCAIDPFGNIVSNGITRSYLDPGTIGLYSNNPAADPYYVRSFKVSDNSITVGEIPGPIYVTSTNPGVANIPYTISGTYTSNEFKVKLSDRYGSFTASTIIGSVTSNSSGSIPVSVTSSIATGNNYRVYIESTNPVVKSLESKYFSIVFDNISPTVTLSGTSSTLISSPVTINIVLSEAVTGIALSDINVINGTPSGLTGSGLNYSVLITPQIEGQVTIQIPQASFTDMAGNPNAASNILEYFFFENDAPKVDISASDGNYCFNTSSKSAVVTFNQDITGFTQSDLLVTNGSVSGFMPDATYPSRIFRFNLAPAVEGSVIVTIPAGAATNGLKGSSLSSADFKYDVNKPTITLTLDGTGSEVTETFTVYAFFSEDVVGLELADITISNGSAGNLVRISSAVYSFDVTPSAYGTVTVILTADKAIDQSGNFNKVSNQLTVNYVITGIEQLSDKKISVYPNPTTGKVNISIQVSAETFNIRVVDINGRLLSDETGASLTTIDLTGKSQGIYFVIVDTGDLKKVFPVILK